VFQRIAVSVLQCSLRCGAAYHSVEQCVVVCWCSVVQCGAVWCSVMQCGAVWCSVVQCGAVCCRVLQRVKICYSVLQSVLKYVAVCCSVLQCVAACCSALECAGVCWSVLRCVVVCLQCAAVCCSVLKCVAVYPGFYLACSCAMIVSCALSHHSHHHQKNRESDDGSDTKTHGASLKKYQLVFCWEETECIHFIRLVVFLVGLFLQCVAVYTCVVAVCCSEHVRRCIRHVDSFCTKKQMKKSSKNSTGTGWQRFVSSPKYYGYLAELPYTNEAPFQK